MRTILLALILLAPVLTPEGALARRGGGPLATGVAPFEGERAGGTPIAEAVELELELVESVVVKGGRWMKRDLRQAGPRAYQVSTLRKIMRKRKLDVLIRGRQVGSLLWVYAYGSDGRARYAQSFALPDNVDERAREIVEDLGPNLDRWASLSPLRGDPADARRPVLGGDEERVTSDEDLFVDFDDDEEEEKPRRTVTPRDPDGRRAIASDSEPDEGSDWDETGGVLDDRDDRGESWDERAAPRDEARGRRRTLGREERFERPKTTLADIERGGGGAKTELGKTHWLSLSLGGDVDGWSYDFTGKAPEQSVRVPNGGMLVGFGGGLRAAYWPTKYLGLEGDGRVNYMKITVTQPKINPPNISTLAYTVGVMGKARYVHELEMGAVGIGARLGYRLWGRGVDLQTSQEDNEPLTVVPGWQQHALAVGVEGYGSLVALDRRFELEVRADALPVTLYAEKPDNPGATSQAIGWSANALLRIPIFHPLTLELGGYSIGSTIAFDGLGDRLRREDGEPVAVKGGQTLNMHVGATVGVGLVF